MRRLVSFLIIMVCIAQTAQASVDPEKLCQAIWVAEGGNNTRHPYGIMTKYKTTTPKQACINTVNSAIKRYKTNTKGLDFISFLGATYCPLSDPRDTGGLNKNWIKNVRSLYGQG